MSPLSTRGAADLSVSRNSNEGPERIIDRPPHLMKDARPEPRRTSENDQPMTAAMGNDVHHPLLNFNNTATPATGHQAPSPQTGVKKTKATLKIATLNI